MRSGRHPSGKKLNGTPQPQQGYVKAFPGVEKYEAPDLFIMETEQPLDVMVEVLHGELFDTNNTFIQSVHHLVMRKMSEERDELLHSGEFAKLPEEQQQLWKYPELWGELEAYNVLLDKLIDDIFMTYVMRRVKEEFWG